MAANRRRDIVICVAVFVAGIVIGVLAGMFIYLQLKNNSRTN